MNRRRIREADLRPHEIDGDIFPDGVEEFDATETLPNPLDTLSRNEESRESSPLKLSPPKRGLVGKAVTVSPGRSETILDWQTDDDDSALPVTIAIGPPNTIVVPIPDSEIPIYGFVEIQYGIGGAQSQLTLDIFPGNMITLPATFIRAIVHSLTTSQRPFDIAAYICRFPTTHPPAKRSIPFGIIVHGGLVAIEIPSMAKSVRVYVVGGAVGIPIIDWNLTILDANLAPMIDARFTGGQMISDTYIIPGDAAFVQVRNVDIADDISRAYAVFEIY